MPGEEPERPGYHVRVQYRELDRPIALDEIPLEWRTDGERPFTRNGKVKQGYAFPLSHAFLKNFTTTFADRLPPDHPPPGKQRVVKIAPG